MRACLATLAVFAAIAGCSDAKTSLLIERQAATLAAATDDGWVSGGAVLVGEPGAFSFPQPLALRFSLVDPDAKAPAEDEPPPMPMYVSTATLKLYGAPVAEITNGVVCQPTYCEAELSVTASGSSMMQVTAKNSDGEEKECFYYAVYEDADPAGAGPPLRDEVEAEEQDCLNDLLE